MDYIVQWARHWLSRRTGRITLKTPEELRRLREAGRLTGQLLRLLGVAVQPGLPVYELDELADAFLREHGAETVFRGYQPDFADTPFPGHICVSINEEVVHGLPNRKRRLREGDIVSIDVGVRWDGYVGDAAATFPVGSVDPVHGRLIAVTREALARGIAQARPGHHIGAIGHAIETWVEHENGLRVIREYVGHGVGRHLHEDPVVPNYGVPHQGLRLRPGLVIAIEPMVVTGSGETEVLPDGWTVVTRDGSFAAHFEHTVAITDRGPWILTNPDEDEGDEILGY